MNPNEPLQPGQQPVWTTYHEQFPGRRRRPLLVALIVGIGVVVAASLIAVAVIAVTPGPGGRAGKAGALATGTSTSAASLPDLSRQTHSGPPPDTSEPTTDAPTEDTALPFGQTGEWEDGMTAVVLSARRASFEDTSTNPGPGIRVTVRITNGTSAAVDLFPTADLRLGSEGTTTEMVYGDNCDGLSDLGRVAARRSVTARLCFSGRATQVDLSFSPATEYEALTWTGKVG